jgi:hypothetical protein
MDEKRGYPLFWGNLPAEEFTQPLGSQVDRSSKHLIMLDFPNGLAMQCSDWTLHDIASS